MIILNPLYTIKARPICLLASLFIFFSSCQTTKIFTPALYHTDIAYLPKPTSVDSNHLQTYISGGLGSISGYNNIDLITVYQAEVSQGWIFKNFNLAYGGFANAGNVTNTPNTPDSVNRKDPYFFDQKGFSALGARVSMNFYQNSGRWTYRILGFEAAYSHEFGDYALYRQSILNAPNYSTTAQTNLLTLGASSEILLEGRFHPYNKFGFRFFAGQTIGNYNFVLENGAKYFSASRIAPYINYAFFVQLRNYFLVADYNSLIYDLSSIRIKIGYHF